MRDGLDVRERAVMKSSWLSASSSRVDERRDRAVAPRTGLGVGGDGEQDRRRGEALRRRRRTCGCGVRLRRGKAEVSVRTRRWGGPFCGRNKPRHPNRSQCTAHTAVDSDG